MNESLVKAWHSAEFLLSDLQKAHAVIPGVATEILLLDMIGQVALIRSRLTRLANEKEGTKE
jgi:hypothetical protein